MGRLSLHATIISPSEVTYSVACAQLKRTCNQWRNLTCKNTQTFDFFFDSSLDHLLLTSALLLRSAATAFWRPSCLWRGILCLPLPFSRIVTKYFRRCCESSNFPWKWSSKILSKSTSSNFSWPDAATCSKIKLLNEHSFLLLISCVKKETEWQAKGRRDRSFMTDNSFLC